jgi:Ca2+-binding RTX toxin-like protein
VRKTVLLLASLTCTFLLASGVALAYGGGGGGTTYNNIRCDGGKCQGTPKDDKMLGTLRRDIIYGLKGEDRMWGRTGRDEVYGFDGNDWATGGDGIDKVSGGDGNDVLLDGTLADNAKDMVSGGSGRDRLFTNNNPGSVDVVNCGSGYDVAHVDSEDNVSDDCENVDLHESGGGGGY